MPTKLKRFSWHRCDAGTDATPFPVPFPDSDYSYLCLASRRAAARSHGVSELDSSEGTSFSSTPARMRDELSHQCPGAWHLEEESCVIKRAHIESLV